MLDMLDESSSPDALHIALGQGVADRVDGIERERSHSLPVDTAELVVVQAANDTQIRQVDKGGYPVGHVGWVASSPDALHVALGQGVADGIDRIESELAATVLIDTAEVVVVQATKGTHSKSGKQEKGVYPLPYLGHVLGSCRERSLQRRDLG